MAQIGSLLHEHLAEEYCARCQYNLDYSSKDAPYVGVDSLGKGAFGNVYRVRKKYNDQWGPSSNYTQLEFARKKFESTAKMSAKDAQQKEWENMRRISDLSAIEQRHMIMLIQSYTVDGNDPDHGHHFLVTYPVANQGSLWQLLEANSREYLDSQVSQNLATIMGCLITGLAILHRDAHLRHHDIHPGNILIHDGSPLYTDFGLSHDFGNAQNSLTYDEQPRQHYKYAAPECFGGPSRGKSADVFMLGGVLYELAAFLVDDPDMLQWRPMKSDTAFGICEKSQAARSALDTAIRRTSDPLSSFWLQRTRSMLEWQPGRRPGAMSIVLQHLQGQCVCSHCSLWHSEMMDMNAKAMSAKNSSAQKTSAKHTSKKNAPKTNKSTEPAQASTETVQSFANMTLQSADAHQRSANTPQYPPATTQYPIHGSQYSADASQYYTTNDPQHPTATPRYFTNNSQYYFANDSRYPTTSSQYTPNDDQQYATISSQYPPNDDQRYPTTASQYPPNDQQPYYGYSQGSAESSRYRQQ